ncbi:2-amino-4-hydroxy-6-hydroxymethyldihydropteridine diphosphokinase [Bacteroidota bacterium]
MKSSYTAYLSLGSNLSDKLQNLKNAVTAIEKEIGVVSKISSVYETPALGFNGNEFYNICIEVKTQFNSLTLLNEVLALETKLGRQRNANNTYQNRVIDIDVILYENEIVSTEKLTIPHPRATERNFVLYPLNEIASNSIFPDKKLTVKKTLKYCLDDSRILKSRETIR